METRGGGMGDLAQRRLTVEEFYEWVAAREQKYELVDGEPVMMAGANRRHDRIAGNAIRVVGNHLQGHRCQPFTSDTYVKIPAGNRRQADMGVDCGPFEDSSLDASEPIFVLEILSPTTRTFDRNDKLEEYKTVPTFEYILLVDPDYPQVRLYQRDSNRHWTSDRLAGLDAEVDMPLLSLRLRLSDLYSGLVFHPRRTLVDPPDNPASEFSI
jgi:Uma2 family endonuclease